MLLKFDSFVRQIKYEKEYRGHLTINQTKFNYRVYFGEIREVAGKPKCTLNVELFDKRWGKVSLDEDVQKFIKERASKDVTEFYERIKDFSLNDSILGGTYRPDDWGGTAYDNIENKLTWSDVDEDKLPQRLNASEFRKVLSRYHK